MHPLILRVGSLLVLSLCLLHYCNSQVDTIILGQGNSDGITITASSETMEGSSSNTVEVGGYLPNLNKSSRFLSQATLGHSLENIIDVSDTGIEDWIDHQLTIDRPFTLLSQIRSYVQTVSDSLNVEAPNGTRRQWNYAWWHYHMSSEDVLRQRVAFALSEIVVISDKSSFGGNPYALGDFYDILLNQALGNYRDLLEEVTFHASMSVYLTYLNNPKSDTTQNRFPDQNYARELMQLFTIGLHKLNNDGSLVLDSLNNPIQAYDNEDIAEFAKIFTGLSWGDRDQWNKGPYKDTSYIPKLKMFNTQHETGVKYLLNGLIVPDRSPVDGYADIEDAIDNLFLHENLPPFISKLLIQRLVTSNPSPQYIERVALAFINNGQGVRGDMKAVVKAILLDEEANDCTSGDNNQFGMLREPFVRYYQLGKAFDAQTSSGVFRNDMSTVYNYVEQKPLTSPSVFNFFQPDYQPLGPVNDENLVAPEFQITDAKTIAGYVNAVWEWIIKGNMADEADLFSGEVDAGYVDERTFIDLGDEIAITNDNQLHVLLDRLNLILAQGRLTDQTEQIIINTLKEFPNEDAEDKEDRVRLAIYFVMTAPEYLINR